jgi:hypothetical protein
MQRRRDSLAVIVIAVLGDVTLHVLWDDSAG